MISVIDQVASGGALRLVWQPLPGATSFRLTRALTQDALVTADDGDVVYEGPLLFALDGPGLVNGTPLWYRVWYMVNGAWVASDPVTQTPVATFADYSVDPQSLVRDRLSAGFQELVRRTQVGDPTPGALLNPESGSIPVLFGSPAFDNVSFPLVTLHMADDADSVRAIGEVLAPDTQQGAGNEQYEGWLSSVQLTMVGWSQNFDERRALRQAIKSIVIANLPVFDAAGMLQVSLRLSDQDDLTSYPAPMYMAMGTLTCLAPSVVGLARPRIEQVDVSMTGV